MSGGLPRRAMLAGGAALAALPSPLCAEAWPTQPIRLVVPFAPGGTTDLIARLLAGGLTERLGQPVIVENRPGAGATVGSLAVAQSAPDGLTLVVSNVASHAIAPALYPALRYDPVRDFTHVALVVENPSILVANTRFAPATLPQVVQAARDTPRGLDVAVSGSGSSNHLLVVQLAEATGARLNHVPYRGAGPAMTDCIAGVVPLMADSLPSAAGHVRAGSVRPVAISSADRHPAFPEVATFREQGVELVSASWFGLSGPANLPPAVTERLAREVAAMLADPVVRGRIAEFGGTPGALSPAGYADFVRAEATRWAPVVRASGASVD